MADEPQVETVLDGGPGGSGGEILDHGPDRGRRAGERLRTCIVTRKALPPGELIRFVRDPDGAVVPDLKSRLPGRGAWVSAQRGAVETACAKKLFARAFRAAVNADPQLPDLVDRLLATNVTGALGLARKAGRVHTGQEQVEKQARAQALAVVFHASDGADEGLRKVTAALRAGEQLESVAIRREFSCDELSLALGLPNVIHAAVPAGQTGAAVAQAAERLARYRDGQGRPYRAHKPDPARD
jgi:hypothetical protein